MYSRNRGLPRRIGPSKKTPWRKWRTVGERRRTKSHLPPQQWDGIELTFIGVEVELQHLLENDPWSQEMYFLCWNYDFYIFTKASTMVDDGGELYVNCLTLVWDALHVFPWDVSLKDWNSVGVAPWNKNDQKLWWLITLLSPWLRCLNGWDYRSLLCM